MTPGMLVKIAEVYKDAFSENRFIEAALLQHTIVDSVLRAAIIHKVVTKYGKNERYEKYFNDTQLRFADLVKNAELLDIGIGTDLIQKLETYNRNRNKIIHGLLYFSSFEEMSDFARQNASDGEFAGNEIVHFMQNQACECRSGIVKKECHPTATL